MTDPVAIFLMLGMIALGLAVISGIRLVQRLRTKAYLSAAAFAIRLALSGYLVWVFASIILAGQ